MISSQSIATSVRNTLRDNFAASGFSYTDAELVEAINRAIKYCGAIAGDMSVVVVEHSMQPGSVQTLSNKSTRLVAVLGNALPETLTERVGVRTFDGQAPVQLVDINFLQLQLRNYYGQPKKKIATMFAVHPDTYSAFTVFPPNDGTGKLTLSIRDELPVLTSIGVDDINVPNFYEGAITSFTVYVALTRDGEDNPLAEDGKRYLDMCTAQLNGLGGARQGAAQ